MKQVRLILALHNHQPVGNLDEVVHRAMEDAYLPFLTVMEGFPDLPFSLHVSGCLFEWAAEHRPEYVDRLAALVGAGRVEIVGGGRGEPIFTMLTEEDAVGQIRSFASLLEDRLGRRPAGAWLPERVWEQHLVGVFHAAGVRYTVVDDFHLKRAGLAGADLYNVALTEDEGRTLALFPSCEKLRYLVPFHDPEESIAFLRSVASEEEDRLVVYADDGEKFGTWPGTKKHVYEKGWLKRFLELLRENADCIRLTTFAEALASMKRPVRVYVPDGSYREMLEWALPADTLTVFREKERELASSGCLTGIRPFLAGGFWRNFKAKYPEVMRLYARMMEVSGAVSALPEGPAKEAASLELYRGQCNCVYWHGVFGGLYLPHLRFAAYKHLIGADRICAAARGGDAPRTTLRDLDFDGREEARLSAGEGRAYVRPHGGAHLYEFDMMDAGFNPLASMTRRMEDYHREVTEGPEASGEIQTIHSVRPTKGSGVRERLAYDGYERECAVDHFFGPRVDVEDLRMARADERGDFASGDYAVIGTSDGEEATLSLRRLGTVEAATGLTPVEVTKRFALPGDGSRLVVRYALSTEEGLASVFGSEFNLAMLSGRSHDRYYYGAGGEKIGPLGHAGERPPATFLGLVDEWQGVKIEFRFTPAASLYLLPVETVSQSEGGFELLYQQSCVIPWWPFSLAKGDRFEATIEIDFIK
ncbi:MAG: alpha-amylase/4-alpha-glucanotransferase domain-containing protein [Planctomycetota bacterium]|jgi:alpha-amylase